MSNKILFSGKIISLMVFITIDATITQITQYQYSSLDARPEKVAYFLKQVLIDWVRFILFSYFSSIFLQADLYQNDYRLLLQLWLAD